jgi:hypothetical protein
MSTSLMLLPLAKLTLSSSSLLQGP